MSDLQFSRRDALNALAASAALPLVSTSGLAWAKPASEAEANALLESIGNNLLATSPEGATSLGLDVGARAKMRYQMGDRSPAGQRRLAATLKADLARA